MKVLFCIAEAYPFGKTGGLGEVGGSLPAALNGKRTKVRVIMPKYGTVPNDVLEKARTIATFRVQMGWRNQYCRLEELVYNRIHYYLIDNEFYFKRNNIYGYGDDAERFAFFSKAVLESLVYMEGFNPDIIHCHDWHTALIPYFMKVMFSDNPLYYGIKTVFTIHNLNYQGIFPKAFYYDVLGLGENHPAWEMIEYSDSVNFMKAAIKTADIITTVSPTYAQEIKNSFNNEILEQMIRDRSDELYGILNAIDTEKYNPKVDPLIFANYRSSSSKKAENKIQLQEILHLPINKKIPLISFISQFADQKGLDLIVDILDEILLMDVQLVILGVGDERYEHLLIQYAEKYVDNLVVKLIYDESLAHKIYAAADIMLVPSLFEPCGLSQMIGMRYGVIPVVRETGGLKDTVIPFNENRSGSNGFSFSNYDAREFLFALQQAVKIYNEEKNVWKQLMENARQGDFSWDKSAAKYKELYENLVDLS